MGGASAGGDGRGGAPQGLGCYPHSACGEPSDGGERGSGPKGKGWGWYEGKLRVCVKGGGGAVGREKG